MGLMDGVAGNTRRERAKNKVKETIHPANIHQAMVGEADGKARTLFWLSVGLHFFLLFLLTPTLKIGLGTYRLIFSLSFLILSGLVIYYFKSRTGKWNTEIITGCAILTGVYVLLPNLLGLIQAVNLPFFGDVPLYSWISLFLILLPIFPIYIGYHAHIPIAMKWLNIWIIVLVIFFIFVAVAQFSGGGAGFGLGTPDLGLGIGPASALYAGDAINYMVTEMRDIFGRMWKGLNWQRLKNWTEQTVGLDYYTGMIDDNEEAPVGLYIDNVRAIETEFYLGYPVTIWADLRGKSFMNEIVVNPFCYVDEYSEGIVDPNVFTVFGEEHEAISCTFDNLDEGSYTAKIGAGFNFETWAYVTYTFVDLDVKRQYEMQGKNINYMLDIEPKPVSVYTNGPVMLGMSSMIDMPIGLDTRHNSREPRLGVTLDNLWTDGEVSRVDEFIIQVPDDFTLVNCDRWHPDITRDYFKHEDGYYFYRFSREEIGDPRVGFQSVTCRLHLETDPIEFLSNSQKIQRTFVAQVKYWYKLEEREAFRVRR